MSAHKKFHAPHYKTSCVECTKRMHLHDIDVSWLDLYVNIRESEHKMNLCCRFVGLSPSMLVIPV